MSGLQRYTRLELFADSRVPLAARENADSRPTPVMTADAIKVIFIIEGTAILRCPATDYRLVAGDVVILGEAAWCAATPLMPSRAVTLYIEPDFLRANIRWIPSEHPLTPPLRAALANQCATIDVRFRADAMHAITPALRRMSDAMGTPEAPYTMPQQVGSLFAHISGQAPLNVDDSCAPRIGTKVVEQAVAYVARDAGQHSSVTELAAAVSISGSQLTRSFRNELGTTPAAYMRDQRLSEMARLLSVGDVSIAESAKRAGWRDASSASRAFKRHYGVSPREYIARTVAPPTHSAARVST